MGSSSDSTVAALAPMTYGDALGRPGTSVAMTLLELCRGSG
ncbi:hypothetical protein [Streptomyces sp. IBSBF 2435]